MHFLANTVARKNKEWLELPKELGPVLKDAQVWIGCVWVGGCEGG